jgi:hypothetical protein
VDPVSARKDSGLWVPRWRRIEALGILGWHSSSQISCLVVLIESLSWEDAPEELVRLNFLACSQGRKPDRTTTSACYPQV